MRLLPRLLPLYFWQVQAASLARRMVNIVLRLLYTAAQQKVKAFGGIRFCTVSAILELYVLFYHIRVIIISKYYSSVDICRFLQTSGQELPLFYCCALVVKGTPHRWQATLGIVGILFSKLFYARKCRSMFSYLCFASGTIFLTG